MAGSIIAGTSQDLKSRTINLTHSGGQAKDNRVNHALKTDTGEQARARVPVRRALGREPTKAEVDVTKEDKGLKTRVTVTPHHGGFYL